jgi:prepilin-type N-terminal cleavage/methylation domain-containing protein
MKKGFTLIEILAVIAVFGVIILLGSPKLYKLVKESKNNSYDLLVELIESGSKLIVSRNNIEITNIVKEQGIYELKLLDLVNAKIIDSPVINPVNREEIPLSKKVYVMFDDNYNLIYCFEEKQCPEPTLYPFDFVKGVNRPKLTTGMSPIKWDGTTWVKTTAMDSEWYDYSQKKWANAITNDCTNQNDLTTCSMWVWIPRYAYQIATGYRTSTAGIINIKFLKEDSLTAVDGTNVSIIPTHSGNSQTNFVKHPAFTFGNTEVMGIWVGKFNPSPPENSDCYLSGGQSVVGVCDDVTITPRIVPGTNSWRSINIKNMFTVSRNMQNSGNPYNLPQIGIDTHMMKNIEWGAVIYLQGSQYGIGTQMIGYNWDDYYTGGGPGNTYVTNTDQSTTGTIYGVYDIEGKTMKYVMGNYNNYPYHSGWSIAELTALSDKYIDRYTEYGISKFGDAYYETSVDGCGSCSTGWNTEQSNMVNSSWPWVLRMSAYGFHDYNGNEYGMYSWKIVLIVE